MKEVSFRLASNKKKSVSIIKMLMDDEDYQTILEDDDILISSHIIPIDDKSSKRIHLCNINNFIKVRDKNKQYKLKIKKYKEEIFELKKQLSEAILFN
jgi:hypothetical protein